MRGLLKKVLYRWHTLKAARQKKQKVPEESLPMVVCCVFKNEAPYLREWLNFHLKQGFQRFYLIDNGSNDHFKEVLQPFIENGSVRLLSSRHSGMDTFIQAREFNAVLPLIREEMGAHCWAAFIDVDEYLFSIKEQSISQIISSFKGKEVAAVLANWLMFGTAGKATLDSDTPMLEQLTRRAPDEHDEHRLFKPIAYLPNVYRFFEGPHRPIAMGGSHFYYSDGSKFQAGVVKFIHSPLRINHYWYRSEMYYRNHKLAKRKSFGDIRNKKLEEWHMARCNEVEDKTILTIK